MNGVRQRKEPESEQSKDASNNNQEEVKSKKTYGRTRDGRGMLNDSTKHSNHRLMSSQSLSSLKHMIWSLSSSHQVSQRMPPTLSWSSSWVSIFCACGHFPRDG